MSGTSLSKGHQEAVWQREELVPRTEGAGSHWQKFRLYIKSRGTSWKGQRHGAGHKIEGAFRRVP